MSLVLALVHLGSKDSDRATQEAAARDLHRHLKNTGLGLVRRSFGSAFAQSDRIEVAAIVDDAVQNVMLSAVSGRNPFRGESEIAARCWCRTALMNQFRLRVRGETRLQRCLLRLAVESDVAYGDELRGHSDYLPGWTTVDAPILIGALREVEAIIAAEKRARDLCTVLAAYRCWLAQALGFSTAYQLEVWGGEREGGGAAANRRALNRIYQYRRRGRMAAAKAVQELLRVPRPNDERVRLLAQLFAGELTADLPGMNAVARAILGELVRT